MLFRQTNPPLLRYVIDNRILKKPDQLELAGKNDRENTMLKTIFTAMAAAGLWAGGALAQTTVPFALDWKFEGPSAAYFAAVDNGYFGAEGLSVEISAGRLSGRHPQSGHRSVSLRLCRYQFSGQIPR